MKVTVEMDIGELKAFIAWNEDRDMYKRKQLENGRKLVRLAEKVMFAIEIGYDDEHYIIADQDHLDELAEMAMEILDE